MTIIDASVLLIAAFFSLYALTSAVEYGIVLKMLSRDKTSRKMFTPLWEVTNVFLVFGFTGLAFLFNGALTHLSRELMGTLGVALVTMLARACLVLSVFYIRDEDHLPDWQVRFFGAATFLVPLTFTASGVYLLTGQLFWNTLLGWTLMLAAAAGLSAAGLLFVNRKARGRALLFPKLTFATWFLLLGCVIPLVVAHTDSLLAQGPIAILVLLSAGGLGLMLLRFMKVRYISLWPYAALVIFLAPLLLAWANRPYLVSGKMTLAQAFGAQTYVSAVVIGLAIMLPLILLGFWLFARLMDMPEDKA